MSSMVIWGCPDTAVVAMWNKGDAYTVFVPYRHDRLPCISRGHAIAKAKRWARKLKRDMDQKPNETALWYDTSAELK